MKVSWETYEEPKSVAGKKESGERQKQRLGGDDGRWRAESSSRPGATFAELRLFPGRMLLPNDVEGSTRDLA